MKSPFNVQLVIWLRPRRKGNPRLEPGKTNFQNNFTVEDKFQMLNKTLYLLKTCYFSGSSKAYAKFLEFRQKGKIDFKSGD